MRRRRWTLLCFALTIITASVFWMTACSNNDENRKEEATKGEQENTDDSEGGKKTDIAGDFGIDMGKHWKYAYNDGTYQFYYLNVSEKVHDRNVVLSIAGDDNLNGADPAELKKSLEQQNKEAEVEISENTAGGNRVVYMEQEEANGDVKAYIGQYIVLGQKESLIFSVYAEESKFETARKSTREVVDTVKIK